MPPNIATRCECNLEYTLGTWYVKSGTDFHGSDKAFILERVRNGASIKYAPQEHLCRPGDYSVDELSSVALEKGSICAEFLKNDTRIKRSLKQQDIPATKKNRTKAENIAVSSGSVAEKRVKQGEGPDKVAAKHGIRKYEKDSSGVLQYTPAYEMLLMYERERTALAVDNTSQGS